MDEAGHEEGHEDKQRGHEQNADINLLVDDDIALLHILVGGRKTRKVVGLDSHEDHTGIAYHKAVTRLVESYLAGTFQKAEHHEGTDSPNNAGQHIGNAQTDETQAVTDDTEVKGTDAPAVEPGGEVQVDEGQGPSGKDEGQHNAVHAHGFGQDNGYGHKQHGFNRRDGCRDC